MYFSLLIVLFAFATPLLLWLWQPRLVLAILKDLRLLRILHYFILCLLGVGLYQRQRLTVFHPETLVLYLQMILFFIALVYAAVFAIVSNNLADVETDRISNPKRPLITGAVEKRSYSLAGYLSLFIAFGLAFLISLKVLLGIFLVTFGYFVYSCPPLRLKRYVFIAKSLIGFNSLVVMVTGFRLGGGHFGDMPLLWLVFVMGPLAFAANFVDLKDTAGDKQMNVNTLPVLLGERKARLVIAGFTFLAYFMGAFLLEHYFIYALATIMCVTHIYFLYRKPYNELPIFICYLSSLITVFVMLIV